MIPLKYPKISGPFKRFVDGPNKNKIDTTSWSSPELELLAAVPGWAWSEKLDGTNVRIYWDGYRPEFGGRTDRADMPKPLTQWLTENITEELLEQSFGATPVVLFGEGIGPKIQSGGLYGDVRTVLFDALILGADGRPGVWLSRDAVLDVASGLGMDATPSAFEGESLESVIHWYSTGHMLESVTASKQGNTLEAEGVVGTAPRGLLDRHGHRIQVKVKARDFSEISNGPIV